MGTKVTRVLRLQTKQAMMRSRVKATTMPFIRLPEGLQKFLERDRGLYKDGAVLKRSRQFTENWWRISRQKSQRSS